MNTFHVWITATLLNPPVGVISDPRVSYMPGEKTAIAYVVRLRPPKK